MVLKSDIFYANLNNMIGHVQGGIRPVVVISNNFNNAHSDNVTVVPISSNTNVKLKTHILIDGDLVEECGLVKESKILCETILTISKSQLYQRIGRVTVGLTKKINESIKVQLAC